LARAIAKVKKASAGDPLTVVLVGPVPSGGLKLIQKNLVTNCSLLPFAKTREDEGLLQKLKKADVVVGQYFTKRMANAAVHLKLLHAMGAGVDDFDLPSLSPQTTVSNVYFHGPAIGEFVMMMVLALSRDLVETDSQLRKGVWHGSWTSGAPPADEIQGKTLGIIGFGHIGHELALRARAFGMKVLALSAHPPARIPKSVDRWSGPEQLRPLLHESDFVVLACPLNDATRGLIGAREFGWMKSSASLIDIARAPIVEESALYEALSKRRIRSAAIDVWYRYPVGGKRRTPSQFPFHKLRNLILTPHIAGWTTGTFARRFRAIADNIDRLASGRPLLNVVQGPARHKALRETRH
jgi:phosphoglycerate dehydrogenase-like enzyme